MKNIRQFAHLAILLLMSACAPAASTAGAPVPQADLPPDGTSMQWVDGSSLVGILCDARDPGDVAHYMWLQKSEVSGYMYDLCVESGACESPGGEALPPAAPAPLSRIGPERAARYCSWIGGDLLTDGIIADILRRSDAQSYLDLASESAEGFRCSVGASHVTGTADFTSSARVGSPMCQTPPLLSPPDSNAAPVMHFAFATTGVYCQGGRGYATVEFSLDEDDHIVGTHGTGSGNCEVLDENRIVCFGEPGALQQGTVSIQCNDTPAEMQPSCLPGYELGPPASSPSEPYSSAPWDVPAPSAPRMCQRASGVASDLGAAGQPVQEGSFFLCPVGTYFDAAAGACVEAFPMSAGCLTGSSFDEVRACCQSNLPSGRTPGCPAGEALNLETGICESRYLFAEDGMFVLADVEVALGACASPRGGGEPGGCAEPPGGCGGKKWDAAKCVCN